MNIGKELLVTLYVMICLLSGIHLADMPNGEQALEGMVDFLSTVLIQAEDKYNKEACLHVAYALNGGTNHEDNATIIHKKDFPVTLEIPTREGYNFAGWYTDSNYQNKITKLNNYELSEIVLYAKWTESIDNYYNVEMYSYGLDSFSEGNQKTLKECNYHFLEYITIPGMPSTRESDFKNNYITEAEQIMQGLCYTQDYILMTAYTESVYTPGTLMIFDRETGEYLVSLKMKQNSHLGGIAYDGENIWICHSESKTLERISYAFIRYIAESGAKYCVDASGISEEYPISNTPSCITCYGGRIWVATHTEVFNGKMISYEFDKEQGKLVALSEYQIPQKVQGVAFDANGSIYLSTSLGRKNSSYLKAYTSLIALDKNPSDPAMEIEMPPCSEEVVFVDGSLFILFESASEKYFEGTDGKGVSSSPLDSLLEIEIASIW